MLDWLSLLILACALPWAAQSARRALRMSHILQLEEYESGRLLRWLGDAPARLTPPALFGGGALAALFLAVGATGMSALSPIPFAAGTVLWGAAGALVFARQRGAPAKKPLVLTPKLLVVLGGTAILWLAIAASPLLVLGGEIGHGAVRGVALADVLLPILLVAANLALYPIQGLAKVGVVQAANLKARRSPAKVVGITGSFGKTSTKEILATLLSAKYRTLKTPSSYNTPLGVSKVILRQLRPTHEMFVVEMGAYHVGDIRGLGNLARPTVGILTAVNPQHLERFGSIENIARAKYELIESLPADGTAIFNNDNDWCRRLADDTVKKGHLAVVRFGLDDRPDTDLTARDLRVSRRGLEFRLVARDVGEVDVQVGLLGRHNVLNVLAASAAALACGMTLREIALAAAAVQPVPHRLQLIEGSGGVTVIDDAYNANPDGARAALEVLGQFADGRKVLVTPGLVELGEREADENRALGAAAATVCDTVILVGPRRTAPIREGLLAAGFPEGRIVTVRGIGEVPAQLQRLVAAGDVVLFENDLPDNYSE